MKKIMALFLLATVLTGRSQVVPNVDWIQYQGSAASPTLLNMANALDAFNSVYVTGVLENGNDKDLVVLKYDSLGNLQWMDTYDNGSDDEGIAISLDASGQYVYVTGVTYDQTFLNDIVTRKYAAATGSVQWSAVQDYGFLGNDKPRAIKVNSNGDAFVTGIGTASDKDYLTLMYDGTSGAVIWAHSYDSGSGNDLAVDLCLSANQTSVYVTGYHATSGNGSDMLTFGLDAALVQ